MFFLVARRCAAAGLMRLVALAVTGAALVLAAPAVEAASLPLTIPSSGKGSPSVLAAGNSGALIAVWATDTIYEGYGPLTVDVVASGPDLERRRWRTRNAVLADSARDSRANLDLLVARLRSTRGVPSVGVQTFTLYRARQDGGVKRLWSGGIGRNGVVARRGSTVAIAWIDYRSSSPALRLVTSTNGRTFSRPRTVRGVLPAFLSSDDVSFVNDFDMTLDADGDPVIAVTAWKRPAATLVLSEITRRGRLRHRQIASDVDGLVQAETTARGRVAVMVDDTGVEGDRGECVQDHLGRRLFATVREHGSTRFSKVQRLDTHPLDCSGRGAQLVTHPGERVAVAWTSSPQGEPSAVRTALLVPGQPFAAPLTIAMRTSVRAAVFGESFLHFFSIQQTTQDPDAGPLVMQTLSASGPSDALIVDANGAGSVLADTDPQDVDTYVAWRRTGDTALHVTGFSAGP